MLSTVEKSGSPAAALGVSLPGIELGAPRVAGQRQVGLGGPVRHKGVTNRVTFSVPDPGFPVIASRAPTGKMARPHTTLVRSYVPLARYRRPASPIGWLIVKLTEYENMINLLDWADLARLYADIKVRETAGWEPGNV